MPVWFAPLIFQGLVAAARAAAPHVIRTLSTQASYVSARATVAGAGARTTATNVGKGLADVGRGFQTVGRNLHPSTVVPAGVLGAALIADSLGVIPSTQSQSQSGSSNQSTVSNHTLGDFVVRGEGGNGGGNGGSNQPGTVITPDTTSPAPEPDPPPPPPPPTFEAVKAAPIDTVTFVDEPYSEGFYADILFEDFGGQELLSISRSDTVNGQRVSYQPFRDLGIIRDQYNPSSLLSIQETSDRFFANFLIKLNQKIPNVGDGPDGKNFYFDLSTGDGIIEVINVNADEQVEIQILNAGIIEDIGI
jgi:hypothetical protein